MAEVPSPVSARASRGRAPGWRDASIEVLATLAAVAVLLMIIIGTFPR